VTAVGCGTQFGAECETDGTGRVVYRQMRPGEEYAVCELVGRVFVEHVAPDFAPEGIRAFSRYATAEALAERALAGHFVLVAVVQRDIVGMIEVRGHDHVSLFFVESRLQGHGIGGELWRQALLLCRAHHPAPSKISVNASLNAVPIYERLGFRPTAPEQVIHGIRFMPMVCPLDPG